MSNRKRGKAHPIICQIIGRECHVSMSTREVVRLVISRLRKGYETFRALSLTERRQFVEDCASRHRQNFHLYADVMNGRAGKRHVNAKISVPSLPSEKYRINNPTEEVECSFCGCPIFLGESAYLHLSEVFCSRHCCQMNRGEG